MRAETPLLANNLAEWPAWLGHPLKSELLGPGDFRLPKLQSDPAEPRWLVEHDTPKGRTLRGWNERLDRSSRDPTRYGSRDSLRSSFAVHLLKGQYREIPQTIERRERRREQNIVAERIKSLSAQTLELASSPLSGPHISQTEVLYKLM